MLRGGCLYPCFQLTIFYPSKGDLNVLSNLCAFLRSWLSRLLSCYRKKDRRRAKYQLMHTVRVNHAARKDAHECIQGIDTDLGRFGVYLNHPVIKTAAAAAIGQNLRRLGPLVLPFSEMVRFQGFPASAALRYVPLSHCTAWQQQPLASICLASGPALPYSGLLCSLCLLSAMSSSWNWSLPIMSPLTITIAAVPRAHRASTEQCLSSLQIKAARNRDTKAVPNFSKAFKHVCIHPGARFVIEKVRSN